MSQLLLKVVTHAYCRYHDQNNLLKDCLSALTSKIRQLDNKIIQQTKQITEVLSLPSEVSQNQMSVIMQQQTQRSFTEETYRPTYQQFINKIRCSFNIQLGKLGKIGLNSEKLIGIYKNQLLEISKQMTKWQSKNQQLKKQIKKITQQKQILQQQNNQLKDQITAQSAEMLFRDIDQQAQQKIQNIFDLKSKNQPHLVEDTPKFKIRNPQQSKLLQVQQTQQNRKQKKPKNQTQQQINDKKTNRNTPKTVYQPNPNISLNPIQVSINYKQSQQDLSKWRKLSRKIQQLKGKLVTHEQQLQEKNEVIKKLTNQVRLLKSVQNTDNQERRKIKTANTTLRGEKSVLQNQVNSLKKALAQKTQLCNFQQIQLVQLKAQVQNFNKTIRQQKNTIQQFTTSMTKSDDRAIQQLNNKLEKLSKMNEILYSALCKQEQQLIKVNQKTIQIQQLAILEINSLKGKIVQMQMILDEKNQCIVRMKSKTSNLSGNQNINPNITGIQNQNAYFNELVRVLTKKVADRDEVIKKLKQAK